MARPVRSGMNAPANSSDRAYQGWMQSSTCRAVDEAGRTAGREYGLAESISRTLAWLLSRQARQKFGGADATGLVAQIDAQLEPGWFRDRLVVRLTRAEAPNPRAGPLLVRLRVLTLLEVAVLGFALVALAWWVRHPGEGSWPDAAPLPPPWPGRTGFDVLVRGGALGALLLAALYLEIGRAHV